MTRFFYLFFCLGLLTFTACGPNYVYEKELEVPETGWIYADSLVATFEIPDTNTIYNLHLAVAHTTYFSYQNFYVLVHTQFPDGQRLTEQLSLELAGKGGLWLGECSGEICLLNIPIQEGAYFNQAGDYRVTIEQYSRRDPLPEISAIHFRLEATEAVRE